MILTSIAESSSPSCSSASTWCTGWFTSASQGRYRMTLCLSTNRFNLLQTNLLISKGISEGHESFKMRSCIRISAALHPSSTGLLLSRENPRTDYGFHFRLCFLRKYTNLSSFLGEFLALLSTFFHILSCDSFQSKPCEYHDIIGFKFSKQWSKSSCGMFGHTLLLEIYQFGNLFDIFDGSNFKHFSFQGSKVCQNIPSFSSLLIIL